MAHEDVYVLIPCPPPLVTLHDKRDSADVIKRRTLRWRDYSGLSGPKSNHLNP